MKEPAGPGAAACPTQVRAEREASRRAQMSFPPAAPGHRLHNRCNGTPIYPPALSASPLSRAARGCHIAIATGYYYL